MGNKQSLLVDTANKHFCMTYFVNYLFPNYKQVFEFARGYSCLVKHYVSILFIARTLNSDLG